MALVNSIEYKKHKTGNHPENQQRINIIMESLEKKGILNKIDSFKVNNELESKIKGKVDVFKPEIASREDILRVHNESHLKHIKAFCRSGGGNLDFDTVVSEDSYQIAKLAAGGAITASKLVINGYESAYSIARPPGHHATRDRAMGFCLFNNLAVAIEYLKEFHGIKKFLIFDFDAHYGNGTAEIFYNNPDVLYISIHQDPRTIFPGSGFVEEIGEDEGKGFNLNIPMPPGSTSQDYIYAIEGILEPVSNHFGADFTFLDVGFDAHREDPLSRINLDDNFYKWITSKMRDIAGRMVLILEGGYNLGVLSRCNLQMINVLKDNNQDVDIYKNDFKELVASDETTHLLNRIQDVFSPYYEF
jgi:acetoin utilization deacetylase AcuC-like enzyme